MAFTKQEFAQKLKQKYPQYKDIEDDVLVEKTLQKFPQYKSQLKDVQKEPREQETNVGGFLRGVGKGLLSTAKGASKLFDKGASAALKTVLPKSAESAFGLDNQVSEAEQLQSLAERRFGIEQGALTTPKTTAQKAGFLTEQIGEFFIPGTAPLKAGRAAKGAVKGSKFLRGSAGLGATAATEAGLAAGQTAIQEGKFGEESTKAAKFGAAFPVAGATAGKFLKRVGKIGAETLGKSTGAGSQAVEEAFRNPNVIRYAREAGKESVSDVMTEALENAKSGLRAIRKKRGAEYTSKLDNLNLNKDLSPVLKSAKTKVNDFAEDLDTIVEGENVVKKAITDINNWDDASAKGLDKLKKRLQSYENQLTGPGKGSAKRIVSQLKDDIRSGLNDNIDGYAEMTSGYRKTSELIDEIENALSLGDKKQKETAIRKLLQTIRRDDDSRKDLLQAVSEASGVDITGKVTGAMLAPKTPRGIAGAVQPFASGLGGATVLLNPSTIPMLLLYFAASSPRVVAEFSSILGQLSRSQIASGSIPINVQRAVRQLIIEAQTESSK